MFHKMNRIFLVYILLHTSKKTKLTFYFLLSKITLIMTTKLYNALFSSVVIVLLQRSSLNPSFLCALEWNPILTYLAPSSRPVQFHPTDRFHALYLTKCQSEFKISITVFQMSNYESFKCVPISLQVIAIFLKYEKLK